MNLLLRQRRWIGLLFCAAVCLCRSDAQQQPQSQAHEPPQRPVIRFVRNPDPAPAFNLTGVDGQPVTLADARGKVVLLNFWATWCSACRDEIPDLIELQTKYKERLQIVSLAVDEDDPSEVKKFVESAGINYPVALSSMDLRVKYGGVFVLPTSFLLDTEGRIVQKHEGEHDPQLYELEIRALLGMAVPATVETFEDTGQIFLTHADRASELPGVDLSALTSELKRVALHRFNAETCPCGCKFTLAQCRMFDRNCVASKARTEKIVAEVSGQSQDSAKDPTAASESTNTP